MKLPASSRAAVLLIGGVGAAVLTSGTAYAYWATSGSGAGSATAGSVALNALQVNGPATAPAGLFPTGSVTGTMTVTNPHPFDVAIAGTGVGAPAFAATTTPKAGCTPATVSFVPGTPSATTIAKNGGSITVPYTATMTNAAEDACQGAAFSAVLTVNAQSVG